MNFLKKVGVSSSVIKEIIRKYDPSVIENAMLDEKKMIEAIIFLKGRGLTNLDELLKNNMTFLFLGKNKIEQVLKKDESIEIAIEKINKDIKYINELMSK